LGWVKHKWENSLFPLLPYTTERSHETYIEAQQSTLSSKLLATVWTLICLMSLILCKPHPKFIRFLSTFVQLQSHMLHSQYRLREARFVGEVHVWDWVLSVYSMSWLSVLPPPFFHPWSHPLHWSITSEHSNKDTSPHRSFGERQKGKDIAVRQPETLAGRVCAIFSIIRHRWCLGWSCQPNKTFLIAVRLQARRTQL